MTCRETEGIDRYLLAEEPDHAPQAPRLIEVTFSR